MVGLGLPSVSAIGVEGGDWDEEDCQLDFGVRLRAETLGRDEVEGLSGSCCGEPDAVFAEPNSLRTPFMRAHKIERRKRLCMGVNQINKQLSRNHRQILYI